MRIISKFHDYYDAGQAHGQDRSLVYPREAKVYEQAGRHTDLPSHLRKLREELMGMTPGILTLRRPNKNFIWTEACPGIILFAGKAYPFVEVRRQRTGTRFGSEAHFVYEFERLEALLAEQDYDLQDKDAGRYLAWNQTEVLSFEKFLALKGNDRWQAFATEYRIAVLSWQRWGDILAVDALVAKLELFRALDAWQAYQELSMFWGNLAAPERNTVVISDKDRIAQHGFDKWSFRKMPGG